MQEKKKPLFSAMEIILTGFLLGSLLLSFLQARKEQEKH